MIEQHRARKRFGQNFLVDRSCIQRIVDAVDPQPSERIVEIGPGLGSVTEALLERVASLDVIEIDRDLAARLTQQHSSSRLRLHTADALKFDFTALGAKLRVVGNLPYNISTPLLFRLIECASTIVDIHVMLQKEVVDRMTAMPGSRDYGRLTVMLGYHFEVQRLFRVGANAFRPQPKVESAFARLRPRSPRGLCVRDEARFARIVSAAFGQRRKTLRNALSGVVSAEMLRAQGFDPQARGETLSVEQFVTLANAISD